MKKIFIVFLLLIITVTSTIIYKEVKVKSDGDVKKLVEVTYAKLVQHTGVHEIPPLLILTDSRVNAWTDGKNIYITTALMNFIGYDKDQIAMVLAHEMAHDMLGHLSYAITLDTRLMEAYADKMGAFIMMRSGYDICKGRMIMDKFLENWGDDPIEDHPPNAYRLNQLSMPWCDKVM